MTMKIISQIKELEEQLIEKRKDIIKLVFNNNPCIIFDKDIVRIILEPNLRKEYTKYRNIWWKYYASFSLLTGRIHFKQWHICYHMKSQKNGTQLKIFISENISQFLKKKDIELDQITAKLLAFIHFSLKEKNKKEQKLLEKLKILKREKEKRSKKERGTPLNISEIFKGKHIDRVYY